jgi:hypothetical protein
MYLKILINRMNYIIKIFYLINIHYQKELKNNLVIFMLDFKSKN